MNLLSTLFDVLNTDKFGPDYTRKAAFLLRMNSIKEAAERAKLEGDQATNELTRTRNVREGRAAELTNSQDQATLLKSLKEAAVRGADGRMHISPALLAGLPPSIDHEAFRAAAEGMANSDEEARGLASRRADAQIGLQNETAKLTNARTRVELTKAGLENAALKRYNDMIAGNGQSGGAGGRDIYASLLDDVKRGRATTKEVIATVQQTGNKQLDAMSAAQMRDRLAQAGLLDDARNQTVRDAAEHIRQLDHYMSQTLQHPTSSGPQAASRMAYGQTLSQVPLLGGLAQYSDWLRAPSADDAVTGREAGNELVNTAAQIAKGRVTPRLLAVLTSQHLKPSQSDLPDIQRAKGGDYRRQLVSTLKDEYGANLADFGISEEPTWGGEGTAAPAAAPAQSDFDSHAFVRAKLGGGQ